jgi:hypothetical protein
VMLAATAAAWPAKLVRRPSEREERAADDRAPATIVSEVQLPTDRPLVRLTARADLEALARATGATMLLRDDGWCAVVADRCVHWWAPDHVPAPMPLEQVAETGAVADVAVAEPDVEPVAEPVADRLEVAPPPTSTDILEQLRNDVGGPRRPLFRGRHPQPSPRNSGELSGSIDEIVKYLNEVELGRRGPSAT